MPWGRTPRAPELSAARRRGNRPRLRAIVVRDEGCDRGRLSARISLPIAVLDVAYDDARRSARVAAVVADGFTADDGRAVVADVDDVSPYVSGAFYERELPCLLALLPKLELTNHLLVIDGYVVLDEDGAAGLGLHLHRATGRPVIGIAKTRFRGSTFATEVHRGTGRRPLWVTAAGVDIDDAAASVAAMAGADRRPTLVVRADHLARGLSTTADPRR